MAKKSFVLFTESKEIVEKLNFEQRGRLLTALFEHAEGTEPDDLDALTDIVYTTIRTYIDKNSEKYAEKCEKNRKNILQRWNQMKESPADNTTEYDRIRPNTTVKEKTAAEPEAGKKGKKNATCKRVCFEKPTVDEVRQYIKSKGYSVDAEKFFDYYDANEWHDKDGRPVKSWKQKIITWSGRNNQEERQNSKGVVIDEKQRAEYGKLSEIFGSGF